MLVFGSVAHQQQGELAMAVASAALREIAVAIGMERVLDAPELSQIVPPHQALLTHVGWP